MSDQIVRTLGPVLHPKVAGPLTLLFLAAVVLGIVTLAPRVTPPDASVPVVEPVTLPDLQPSDEPGDGFVLDAAYLAGQFDLVVDMQVQGPADAAAEPGIVEGGVVMSEENEPERTIAYIGMIEDFRGLTAVLRVDGQQRWIRQGSTRDGVEVIGIGENAARLAVDGVPTVVEKLEAQQPVVGSVMTPIESSGDRPTFDPARSGRPTATSSAAEDQQRRAEWSRAARRDIRRAQEGRAQESRARDGDDDRDGREAGER